jgi:hypothetical protein
MLSQGSDTRNDVPQPRTEPAERLDWLRVVDAMERRATADGDPLLFEVSQAAHAAVHDHVVYPSGCPGCGQDGVDSCPWWETVQRLVFAWLCRQAGV